MLCGYFYLIFSLFSLRKTSSTKGRTAFSQVADAEGDSEGCRVKGSKQKGVEGWVEGWGWVKSQPVDSTCASYACMRDATREAKQEKGIHDGESCYREIIT
ncbi:uncharacterized protein BDW47DRAFT_89515 [Aspergillus candidus]|uniref:Uncharacterized protein n=1 Tax=Aspergillus candidus TaxID=41067 RepID=A0A2I2FJ28_ASPCN|nr:hypothetical protein BDW47DRAFT_89515 [Aspergillus candidus]PLB40626.1 hypothetical protein BDW47DRAFT_89515 [Aspergillus candidus]